MVPGDVRVLPGPPSDLAVNPRPVFAAAEQGDEVVITSRGKPVALLLSVSGDDLEETVRLVRRAKAQAAASRMRKATAQRNLDKMAQEDIEGEITTARHERSTR